MSLNLTRRSFFVLGSSAAAAGAASLLADDAAACCPAPPASKPVVNADQTVIIVWDPAKKTQHFIRQASFRGDSDDFGFLIPTPTAPELDESGDAAFPLLANITAPAELPSAPGGCSGGCFPEKSAPAEKSVRVISERTVAGFNATVLEASSTDALTSWLKDREYAFSPEVEAWAKPYVEGGWKITALRLARKPGDARPFDAKALRMSFQTEQPLFPYREPAAAPGTETRFMRSRLLRIYFLSDCRYEGTLTKEVRWTGVVAWSGEVSAKQLRPVTEALGIASLGSDTKWWLTEFEDEWPYKLAPADLYFTRAISQDSVERPPVQGLVERGNEVSYALAAAALVPLMRRLTRRT